MIFLAEDFVKTLHFECAAGISGDMALGAFVDLGVEKEYLIGELHKLGVEGWHLEFVRDERKGIFGTRAIVHLDEMHHDHEHEHEHAHEHHHEHSHTSWKDIRNLIENSGLSLPVKNRALDIFSRIAQAESQVHGVPEDQITFHEVGALDSIIDIVGAAICLDELKPDRITCSDIELGGGTLTCAHGVLPVPAPATLILCQGLPVKTGGFSKEMTTPTGAAILASCVDEFIETARFIEIKTAYGIGTRKLDRPNVLRVSWREEKKSAVSNQKKEPWETGSMICLETNIDDMTGEAMGFLMDRLFEAKAVDVFFLPCTMKKSRPGVLVSVLCREDNLDTVRNALFRHSTTLGFRETKVNRLYLRREIKTKSIDQADVRVKTSYFGEEPLHTKIEFEDRARIAQQKNITLEDTDTFIKNHGAF